MGTSSAPIEIRANDSNYDITLVTSNLNLAIYLAKFYCTTGVDDLDELISEAYIGLVKAAKTFDAKKNIAFGTYATKCIVSAVLQYKRLNGIHHKPFLETSGDKPLFFKDNGECVTLFDFIPDSSDLHQDCINKDFINNAMHNLTAKEQLVIYRYFYQNKTLTQIGTELGVSKQWAYEIKEKAIKKMREYAELSKLSMFV